MTFLKTQNEKIIRFVWNHKRPRRDKAILRKKNEAGGGITLPDFKLYYTAMIIKITWYCQQNMCTDQGNRIESPEIKPYIHGQINFGEGAQNNGEKKAFSITGAGKIGRPHI